MVTCVRVMVMCEGANGDVCEGADSDMCEGADGDV